MLSNFIASRSGDVTESNCCEIRTVECRDAFDEAATVVALDEALVLADQLV